MLLGPLETFLTSNFKKQEFKTRFKTFENLLPPIFILKCNGRKLLEITKPRAFHNIVSNEVEILSVVTKIKLLLRRTLLHSFKIDLYFILYECIYNQCVLSYDKKDSNKNNE